MVSCLSYSKGKTSEIKKSVSVFFTVPEGNFEEVCYESMTMQRVREVGEVALCVSIVLVMLVFAIQGVLKYYIKHKTSLYFRCSVNIIYEKHILYIRNCQ